MSYFGMSSKSYNWIWTTYRGSPLSNKIIGWKSTNNWLCDPKNHLWWGSWLQNHQYQLPRYIHQSPYNIILGCPTINSLGLIESTRYLNLKYSLLDGKVGTIRDQQAACECYLSSLEITRNELALVNAHPSEVPNADFEGWDPYWVWRRSDSHPYKTWRKPI